MSQCASIARMLSEDDALAALTKPSPRILQGSLENPPPFPPPFILVSCKEHIPLIENEDDVLAEKSICTVGILATHDMEALAARVQLILALAGYRIELSVRREASRPDWQMCEIIVSKGVLCL
jgi:hypothetical protein